MTSTKVTEVSEKMNVSFTSSGEVGVTFLGLSLKAGKSISSGLELTTKTITSFEETSLQSISIEYTFQAPNPVRLVTYQLIDYYELFRQDGTLVSDWEVLTPQAHRVQYPSEEDYGGRSSSGTSFIMEDGAIIPIYNTVETSDKISDDSNSELDETFKIQLSPNPTTEKINLTYNSSALEEAEIYIYIYTQAGTLHRQEKLQSSTAGNSVDISDLPTGLYFVKVISGKHSSTTRIFKE
jgi:hypothetical protein